jgi:hypothetical protein
MNVSAKVILTSSIPVFPVANQITAFAQSRINISIVTFCIGKQPSHEVREGAEFIFELPD